AGGQRIAFEQVLAEAQIVGERLDFLVDDPEAGGQHLLVGIDRAAAVDVGRGAGAAVAGDERGQRLRAGAGEQAVGRRRAGDEVDPVADGPVADIEVHRRAEHVEVDAAAVGEVAADAGAAAGRDGDVAEVVAEQGAGLRVQAREARQAGAVVARQQRDRSEERILVVGVAGVDGDLAAVPAVGQGGAELAALVGGELGVAHAVGGAVETADA
ncbi:hypothetical protein CATMIT_02011, partial [Catenibacterium mitsuokai DSM 15897]